jgi:hypothetical protein
LRSYQQLNDIASPIGLTLSSWFGEKPQRRLPLTTSRLAGYAHGLENDLFSEKKDESNPSEACETSREGLFHIWGAIRRTITNPKTAKTANTPHNSG